MAKKKSPTPQEIYHARKKREEEERDALLPPGFINHGNTCFMNSVLQGLLATQPLHQLVKSEEVSVPSKERIESSRSPQLVNHRADDQHWDDSMPLGEVFLGLMEKGWATQTQHRRESMSPRDVLAAIGKKYDQYLDFAQQDAHEFLRQLLDAMRMEEMDMIKKRYPPSRHRRPSRPPEHESFVDMLFGGQLASILVCQKCKHISHTYEEFNDLSLSIHSDDLARDRKRDRLKNMAKKWVSRSAAATTTAGTNGGGGTASLGSTDRIQRPSSVPPPAPLVVVKEHEALPTDGDEPRRKSWDVIAGTATPEETKDEGWTKIGRRISILGGGRKSRPSSPARLARADASAPPTAPSSPPRTRSPSPSPLGRALLRSKSPKPPKPTSAELDYLREVLADIRPATTVNPFTVLTQASTLPTTDPGGMWLKISQLQGIEECLRLFTSVENLEGENMVGCRRCWKIKHGQNLDQSSSSSSEDEDEDEEKDKDQPGTLRIQTTLGKQGTIRRLSVSTPVLTQMFSPQSSLVEMSDGASVSSLPLSSEAGMSIPSISTTAPDEDEEGLDTLKTPVALNRNSLQAPTIRYGGDSSDDESDNDQDESDVSSLSSTHSSLPPTKPTARTTTKKKKKKKEKETIPTPAYKRYLISKPPPILVIHLKRFQQLTKTPYLSFSNGFKKMDDYVAFGEFLDLTPFLVPSKKGGKKEKCMYRLYAVVVHLGNMLGGHYVAYTALPSLPRGEDDKKTEEPTTRQWSYISDTTVRLASLEEVLKSKAYLCMYERVPV